MKNNLGRVETEKEPGEPPSGGLSGQKQKAGEKSPAQYQISLICN